MNFYLCIHPCNSPDQDIEYFFLPSPVPLPQQGSPHSSIYYVDFFCLFLNLIKMESCSIFCFCFWPLPCSMLSVRFIHAVFSSSFFLIMQLYCSLFNCFPVGYLHLGYYLQSSGYYEWCFCEHPWTCFAECTHLLDPLFLALILARVWPKLLFSCMCLPSRYDCYIPGPNLYSTHTWLSYWAGPREQEKTPSRGAKLLIHRQLRFTLMRSASSSCRVLFFLFIFGFSPIGWLTQIKSGFYRFLERQYQRLSIHSLWIFFLWVLFFLR